MRSEYKYAIIELEELIASVEEDVGSIRLADAARLAVKALRKQEPMMLEIDGEFNLLCGGCGCIFDVKGSDDDYCPRCGQKLDWS